MIGLMSRKAWARPWCKNDWKLSRWMAIRSGKGSVSSKSANEKRSGLLDRAGNGLLLYVVVDRYGRTKGQRVEPGTRA